MQRSREDRSADLYSLFQLVTFWPIRKEYLFHLPGGKRNGENLKADLFIRNFSSLFRSTGLITQANRG